MILCADIGTSSLKAALTDSRGTVVSFFREPLNTPCRRNTWYDAFRRACLFFADNTADIAAISISGNGPSLVTDTAVHLWNEQIPAGTVAYNGSSLFVPRILHIQHNFPEEWDSSPCIMSGPEFLIFQLTGSAMTVLPEHRYTPYYWTPEELARCGIPEKKLPPFIHAGEQAGELTPQAAADLSLPQHRPIPVFSPGPDFAAAVIGTNTLYPGAACDRAGSSEGISLCTAVPIQAAGIRTLPSVAKKYYNASVLLQNTGAVFQAHTPHELFSYLSDMAESTGNSLKNTPETAAGYQLLDTAFRIKQAFDGLQTEADKCGTPKITVLRASGGQAKITEWLRMKCDILNIPVETTNCLDAELTGNVITAQTGLGLYSCIEEAAQHLVTVQSVYMPDSARAERYTHVFKKRCSPQIFQ